MEVYKEQSDAFIYLFIFSIVAGFASSTQISQPGLVTKHAFRLLKKQQLATYIWDRKEYEVALAT